MNRVTKKRGLLTIIMLFFISIFLSFSACTDKVENFNLTFKVDGENYTTLVTTGKESIVIPENPTKEGYTFDGWYWDDGEWQKPFTANSLLDASISSDMSLYAKFTTIPYVITYETGGGAHNNPVSYTVEDSFTLSNAERNGYIFNGWYNGENKVMSVAQGTMGELIFTAKWSVIPYTISYTNTKDVENNNPVSYTIESDAITLSPLSKRGYTFDGWYSGETKVIEIAKGSTGDLELTAKWSPIGYEITYHNAEGATNANPETYDVEDEPLALVNAVKEGYTFRGWYTDASYQNAIDEIAVGTTGNLDLYAKFEIINYDITYIYDQTKVVSNSNKAGYTVLDNVTFDALTVISHYQFDGWFIDSTYQTAFTGIVAGTLGEKTVYGKITPVVYTITYENTKGVAHDNPTTYTIESADITFAPLSKDGYTFTGWDIVTIASGSFDNKTITATWIPTVYNIIYANTKGVTNNNPANYTIESEDITFAPLSKNGYTFTGWDIATIASGSTGDKTITANWTLNIYTITYANTKDAENNNPMTYTVESEDITFAPLGKDGYTFTGWDIATIASGSTGNKTITANWTLNIYTIAYEYNDTIGGLENGTTLKTSYTVEDEFTFTELVNKTEGYTFNGWYTQKNVGTGEKVNGIDLGTIGNKTYYAQWGLETYTISYHNVDGVTNTNATTYTVETDDFTISSVSKVGYEFGGWYSDEACLTVAATTIAKGSTGNLNYYAKWTPTSYTINYTLYGGTVQGEQNPTSYTIEDGIELKNPTQDGYVFVGWYNAAENGKLVKEITVGSTGTLSLCARWLQFESNGGTEINYTPTIATSSITKPENPTKAYYEFVGWYFDAAFTSEYKFNKLPTANATLYAKWTPVEYTIHYELNGGTNHNDNPATYNYEDVVTFLAPTKTGYTFNGWYSNDTFSSALVEGIALNSHGEVTVYASYTINQYTISFDTNGGTEVEDITQNYATKVNAPAEPAKTGYTFVGWYENSDLTNKYVFTTMPANNLTLYAKWSLVTYNIVYNTNGGTNSSSNKTTYNINSQTINLYDATKAGYEFKGWYSDSEYTTPVTNISTGSYGDKELFAKFEIIEYTITYIIPEGASNSNLTVYTIETDLTTLENATLKGHTFNGWYTSSSYTTAIETICGGEIGNKTIYGKFTVNTYNVYIDGEEEANYTVSFNLNGAEGDIDAQTITETNGLVYPTVPTREGYLFAGWFDNATCEGEVYDFTVTVVKDVTLYAKWIAVNGTAISVNGQATVPINGTENKVYSFVPLVSGNVSIMTTGDIDTYGVLYNANGAMIAQDDDSASDGINFLMVYNVTASKLYTVHVRSFSSGVTGSVVLSVSGNNTITAGGLGAVSTSMQIAYGSDDFTIALPAARDGYKFLGYMDSEGVLYTDKDGNAINALDKGEDTVLYSKWEKMVYTVTFITSGGTAIDQIQLGYGERLDLNECVTTRTGYSFLGWYLNATDTETYEATTMPDYNITLTAAWTNYSLGSIKYNTVKKEISVNDTVNGALFGAICIDTDGNAVEITGALSASQTAGSTVIVKLTATKNGKTATQTITDVKIYGMPTIAFDDTVTYFNMDNFTPEWFTASGLDTYGVATTVQVYVDGEYKAGDIVTVTITSTDVAGNTTCGYVQNVKVYGAPVIAYDEEKTGVSVNDTINAELFSATATDSFGEELEFTVTNVTGSLTSGTTITVQFSATDSKGNENTFTKEYKVYGMPTISYAQVTEFTENDVISNDALSVTAYDVYGEELEVSFSAKQGTQTGGTVLVWTASAVDSAGNVTNRDIAFRIYGTPTITYERAVVKTTDEATANPSEVLNAKAYNSFGKELTVTAIFKSGSLVGGEYVIYTLSTIDHLGNSYSIDTAPIPVYDIVDITNSFTYSPRMTTNIKVTSGGEEFETSALDSFGEACTITVITENGGALTAGQTQNIYLVATDKAGNSVKSSLISNIKVFDLPTITYTGSSELLAESVDLSFYIVATNSFGDEIYAEIGEYAWVAGEKMTVVVTATDDAGNTTIKEFIFHCACEHIFGEQVIAATCAEQGYTLHLCSVCGYNYKDTYTAALTHTHAQDAVGVVTAPTCTVQGYTTYTCLLCSENYDEDYVAAKGHTYIDGVCVVCGETGKRFYGQYSTTSTYYLYLSSEDKYTLEIYGTGTIGSLPTEISGFKSKIEKIHIHEGIASISHAAFSGCGGLTSITVPFIGSLKSATNEDNLFGYIFGVNSYTGGTAKRQSYSSNSTRTYYIPSSLKEVTIMGGNIYYGAFSACSDLTSITIPDGVTSIGEYAFSACSGLTSITIPDSVTEIGKYAFKDCSGLTSITIPDSVTSIGAAAFNGCSGLTSVDIGNSVTSIEDYAFCGCSGLTGELVIPDGVTSIGEYAFKGCSGLTSVDIGNSVTSIENSAFRDCIGLTSVDIGNSVTSISVYAFYGCSGLTSITIPDSVTEIGKYAFYGCSGLTSIIFKDTSTWYYTGARDHNYTGGSIISVTNASSNAVHLGSRYYTFYWYKV